MQVGFVFTLMDMELIKNVIKDFNYVLYNLLPPKMMHGCSVRSTRPHKHVLPIKIRLCGQEFSGQNAAC